MKANISRMWRSGLALLMVLCMVVGVFPAAAFATEEKTVNLDAIVDLLDEYGPEMLKYGYNYASANGDIKTLSNVMVELKAAVKTAYAQYTESDMPELSAVAEAAAAKLVAMEDALKALKAELVAQRDALLALNAGTVEKVDAAVAEVEAVIAEVEDAIAAVRAAINDVKTVAPKLAAKLEKAGIEMDSLKGAVKSLDDAVTELFEIANGTAKMTDEQAEAIYAKARKQAVAAADEVKLLANSAVVVMGEAADIALSTCEAVAKAAKYVKDKLPLLEGAYSVLPEYLQTAIEAGAERMVEEAKEAAAQIKAENAEELAAAKAELAALKAKLVDVAEEYKPEVKAQIAALEAKIAELSGKELIIAAGIKADDLRDAYTKSDVKAVLAKALEVVKANADPAAESAAVLANTIKSLAATTAEVLGTKAENAIAALKAAYYEATHDDYKITTNSYYVAIGDGSAVSDSYVDALDAKLEAFAGYEVDGNNLAVEGLLIENAGSVIADNKAEIEKADLVTIGFGNAAMLTNAMAKLVGEGVTELPWENYVNETGAAYVERVINTLDERLAKTRLDDGVRAGIVNAVEAYLFNCVSYAYLLPQMVDEINAINPDAVVVVVGMYNSMDGVTLNYGDVTVDLTGIMDAMVKAVGLHDVVYAMITGNCIYVDAPAAETQLTDTELNELDVMRVFGWNGGAELNPSEAGHEYIAEQIWNALNVTSRWWLLGDVDHNGVVNHIDAMLVLQYYVGMIDETGLDLDVADVDGDGVYGQYDAMYILQLYTGIIEKLPADV